MKNRCVIALKEDQKPQGIIDAHFVEKDEFVKTDILLALEDKVLLNVQTVDTTTKDLWENLNRIYMNKSLVGKIYLWWQLYNFKMKDFEMKTRHRFMIIWCI